MTKQADDADEPLRELVQFMLDRKFSAERFQRTITKLFRVRAIISEAVQANAIEKPENSLKDYGPPSG